MKKKVTVCIFLFTIISCKAQIRDISDLGWNNTHGVYYKDINNLLDPFVGNYIYTNGDTSLKIVLQKKEMSSINGLYYEDTLIGEYQYIQDGVEKINTLDRLNENFSDGDNYDISGNAIIGYGNPGCRECGVDEKALRLGMVDRTSEDVAFLYVRRLTIGGQAAIKIFIWWQMKGVSNPATVIPASVPGGREFILIKQ